MQHASQWKKIRGTSNNKKHTGMNLLNVKRIDNDEN